MNIWSQNDQKCNAYNCGLSNTVQPLERNTQITRKQEQKSTFLVSNEMKNKTHDAFICK